MNNQATSASSTLVETSSTLTEKCSSDRVRMRSVISQISNRSSASISNEHPALSPQTSSSTIPPVLNTIPATIINMNPTLSGERHIGFRVYKENNSNESNHTALMMNDDDGVILIDALLNTYRLSSTSSLANIGSSFFSTRSHINNVIKNTNTTEPTDGLIYRMFVKTADPRFNKQINTHFTAVSAYLEKPIEALTQVPLMILYKSSVLLEDKHYSQILYLF
ncbi:unnamed protein product [Rotaria sordida]|uniref:Uncharacterized protein n=1 Tax=Rotaria sordida TaxID=392033 RepID=A0A814V5T3_9BILA|nr:unnamed protein product [Rotaria sordida]CAF1446049.1 unnamed protein product [Rotaria sordida]